MVSVQALGDRRRRRRRRRSRKEIQEGTKINEPSHSRSTAEAKTNPGGVDCQLFTFPLAGDMICNCM
jgi:hypothetical protein